MQVGSVRSHTAFCALSKVIMNSVWKRTPSCFTCSPNRETLHPAPVVLVCVFLVLTGAGKSLGNPGDSGEQLCSVHWYAPVLRALFTIVRSRRAIYPGGCKVNTVRLLHPTLMDIGHLIHRPRSRSRWCSCTRAHPVHTLGSSPGGTRARTRSAEPRAGRARPREGAASERLAPGARSWPVRGSRLLEGPRAEGARRARAP